MSLPGVDDQQEKPRSFLSEAFVSMDCRDLLISDVALFCIAIRRVTKDRVRAGNAACDGFGGPLSTRAVANSFGAAEGAGAAFARAFGPGDCRSAVHVDVALFCIPISRIAEYRIVASDASGCNFGCPA